MEHLAEADVLLLLFSIGIEFSLAELLRMARPFLIGGTMQMTLVGVPTAIVAATLRLPWQSAVLLGAAAAFSSTVLVFKALEEWGEATSSHGRRAIAILLYQDAAVVPLVLLVPFLTGQSQGLDLAAKSLGFLVAAPIGRWLLDDPQLADSLLGTGEAGYADGIPRRSMARKRPLFDIGLSVHFVSASDFGADGRDPFGPTVRPGRRTRVGGWND